MRRTSPLCALLPLVAALSLLAGVRQTRGDEPVAPPPLVSTEISPEERDIAVAAASGVVRICLGAADAPPSDSAGDVFGVQLSEDGLVLTTHAFLIAAANDRARREIWVRRGDLGWERAVAVARTPFGDLGVVRALRPRATGRALALSEQNRVDRAILVRPAPDGRALADATHRVSTSWTDPALGGDRVVTTRSALAQSPGPKALSYRTEWEATRGSDAVGAPLVDARGALLGLVVEASGGEHPSLVSTPAEYLKAFVRIVEAEGVFRPPDLGVRFSPTAIELAAGQVPKDLTDVRTAGKFRGGALVGDVPATGPASELLWPGDVVLEIGGRPVSSTVPESFLPALSAIAADEKTAIAVWRGGKKQLVWITPRAAESAAR